MAAQGRPPEPTLKELLYREPHRFNFFQAVRLLQALSPHRDRIGEVASKPERESVRFRVVPSLAFAANAISGLTEREGRPVELSVAFFGMIGPSGVLPLHYTHQAALQAEQNDHSLRDFMDWFHHRLLSLFYRAWEKRRLFMSFENSLLADDWNQRRAEGGASALGAKQREEGPFEKALFGAIGLGLPSLRRSMELPDLSLLHYAGLLIQRPRSAMTLQALLADYFKVTIEVQQFAGQYAALGDSDRPSLGKNGILGVNMVVGDRVWLPQSKFRLRMGPLTFVEYIRFLPKHPSGKTNPEFVRLVQLTRWFVGPELDFDIQIVLRGDAVPRCELGRRDADFMPQLGQSIWLFNSFTREHVDESIFPGRLDGLFSEPLSPT